MINFHEVNLSCIEYSVNAHKIPQNFEILLGEKKVT